MAAPTVIISNLGLLPSGPTFTRLRLVDPRYAAPTVTSTADSLIAAVATHDGVMRFVCSYDPVSLDAAVVVRVCEHALQRLRRVAQDQAPLSASIHAA